MLVIASFNYSMHLELAITYLERKGIDRESIFAVPLDKRDEKKKIFDSINQSDGISLFDAAIILATIFMLFGSIYGFVLKWGPIICGVIASIIGGIIGFAIDIIPKKGKHKRNKLSANTSEMFLLIECEKKELEIVEGILWDNLAIGLAKIDNSNGSK